MQMAENLTLFYFLGLIAVSVPLLHLTHGIGHLLKC